jgi:hypothetical protein
MTTRIKLRRDTAANWTTNDPVLALGEAGYDTTNNELRVGDGTTVWSGLESIGGTGDKIIAEKTYSNNYSDGNEHTFAYTTGSIAVQIGNDDGLYLNDLLSRWVQYFDGNLAFPYNYSNINLVINPGTDDLASTVTNVISDLNEPPLYTITLGTAHPEPITIDDIDFNYNYINTIGLDIVNGDGESNVYFGMATGDDDITIRSGRDINLIAADDIDITAGSTFDLTFTNLDDNSSSDGIDIRTITTSTDYTWTFRFDGDLDLPGGLVTTGTLVVDVIREDFGGGFMFYNTATNEVTHNPYVPLGMMQGPMQTLNSVTTGTNTFDCDNGHIFYVTQPQGDWTVNFINANNFYPNQVIAMSIIIEQGATAYLPTAVQVQGNATTLTWLNNTPPTGHADRTDVVAYRIICTATNTYKVLAQLMGY